VKANPFQSALADLPRELPIFPLPGVILLPRAQLPLNVFEPRYLAMTEDALGAGRLIGMVQPDPAGPGEETVYGVGCAGRITAFSETEDGRLLVVLTGVCRFGVGEELPGVRGYRRVAPRWEGFGRDLAAADVVGVRPAELLSAVRRFLDALGQQADLETLAKLGPDGLVSALAMNLPFAPEEKQALLEAPTLGKRAEALVALAELGASGAGPPPGGWH